MTDRTFIEIAEISQEIGTTACCSQDIKPPILNDWVSRSPAPRHAALKNIS
jgi:hypothetical protein